jgi:hypothetical protein
MGSSDPISTAAKFACWRVTILLTRDTGVTVLITSRSLLSAHVQLHTVTAFATNSQTFCSLERHWAQHHDDTRAS